MNEQRLQNIENRLHNLEVGLQLLFAFYGDNSQESAAVANNFLEQFAAKFGPRGKEDMLLKEIK